MDSNTAITNENPARVTNCTGFRFAIIGYLYQKKFRYQEKL